MHDSTRHGLLSALLFLSAFLGTTFSAPPPAEAQAGAPTWSIPSDYPYLEILSGTGTVSTAAGIPYQLSVDAMKGLGTPHKDGGELRIRLQRTRRSPETSSTQSYTYDFFLDPASVHYRADLSRVRVDTGALLGPLGRVILRFRSTGAPQDSCGGLNATATGVEAGSVTFLPPKDNGFFGTITRSRFRNVTVNKVTGCFPSSCPPPNFSVMTAPHHTQFEAENLGGSEPAHQVVEVFGPIRGLAMHASYDLQIDATVPASTVALGVDGTTVQWTTLRRTFLRGATTFTWDPLIPPNTLPIPCREGATQTTYIGEMTGRIVGLFDTGRKRMADDIPHGAQLTKIT